MRVFFPRFWFSPGKVAHSTFLNTGVSKHIAFIHQKTGRQRKIKIDKMHGTIHYGSEDVPQLHHSKADMVIHNEQRLQKFVLPLW